LAQNKVFQGHQEAVFFYREKKYLLVYRIYWGCRRGGKVTLLYPKKNIFDQYSAVDNLVDKLLISLAICNHSCILRIIRLLKNWMSIKGTIQIQRLLVYPISVGTYI